MRKMTLFMYVFLYSFVLIAHENFTSENNFTSEESYSKPGISVFAELGGKGYYSGNIEFPIYNQHRLSIGFTVLDYDFSENVKGYNEEKEYLTPGVMYYYLFGKKRSFFELGGGVSVYPRFNENDYDNDSPVTLHGVIGYRYQKKNGLLFRAGFTPFKRINNWFLPLIGVSLGYSW